MPQDHFYRRLDGALDLTFVRSWVAGCYAGRVIADAKYATTTNIRMLEEEGILAYVPLPEWDKASKRFKRTAFTYDPEQYTTSSQGRLFRRTFHEA